MGILSCLPGFLPVYWAYQLGFSYMPIVITPVQGNLEKVDRPHSILNQNLLFNIVGNKTQPPNCLS